MAVCLDEETRQQRDDSRGVGGRGIGIKQTFEIRW
jgi:hypothetical protein